MVFFKIEFRYLWIIIGGIIASCSATPECTITPLTQPWETVVPNQEVPEGLTAMNAQYCGSCHAAHYKEWKTSTHAYAWVDKQFQSELKKESSPFFCVNCHLPIQNQHEHIVTGYYNGDLYAPVKTPNPSYDSTLRDEGISCAGCHVRNNAIVGVKGSSLAPHKVVKDVAYLSENLCVSCHNAQAVVTDQLACSFETGDEWLSGPYADKENCISCHMPETHRPWVAGYEAKKSRYHTFAGSGIPKVPNQDVHRLEGLSYRLVLEDTLLSMGEEFEVDFFLKNDFAGHNVPSGDPERFLLVEMLVTTFDGDTVAKRQERIGEVWQWYPSAKKIADNNLKPLEERVYHLSKKLDRGNYLLAVQVSKHRMDLKTAVFNKLGEDYPLMINVFHKSVSVKVE